MVNLQGIENRFELPHIIAQEALYRLKHQLVMPHIANRTYEKYFEQHIGKKITVKRPFQIVAHPGRIMKKSEMIDKTVEIEIGERWHVALGGVDEDFTFAIKDYGQRYLQAGVEELAYRYEITGSNELGNNLFMTDGTPGTGLQVDDAQQIRSHSMEMAIPQNNQNFAIIHPRDLAAISTDLLRNQMNDTAAVGSMVRKVFMGELVGYNVITSVHMPYYELPRASVGTPLIAGANQIGDTIMTDGWSPNGTKVLNAGNLIQIAGVYEVQPRGDRRPTGRLQTFKVVEDVTSASSGNTAIKIYPEINTGAIPSEAYLTGSPSGTDTRTPADASTVPNPSGKSFSDTDLKRLSAAAYKTVSNAPMDNAKITIIGQDQASTGEKRFRQSIFTLGDALEYINVQLAIPKSAYCSGVSRDAETGVIMTYLCDYSVKEVSEQERIDIYFGTKCIYPELGIRHIGAKIDSAGYKKT